MIKNVVVATRNQGKLDAVKRALDYMGEKSNVDYEIVAVEAESGVPDTPLSDEEGLKGCANRLSAIKKSNPNSELYIALEGVLTQVGDKWFVRGWTMLEEPSTERVVVACGAAVQVPQSVTSLISSMDQFSETVKSVYAVTEAEAADIRNMGANGVFSGGEYTRRDTFYDGIRICLAELANDRNWPGE